MITTGMGFFFLLCAFFYYFTTTHTYTHTPTHSFTLSSLPFPSLPITKTQQMLPRLPPLPPAVLLLPPSLDLPPLLLLLHLPPLPRRPHPSPHTCAASTRPALPHPLQFSSSASTTHHHQHHHRQQHLYHQEQQQQQQHHPVDRAGLSKGGPQRTDRTLPRGFSSRPRQGTAEEGKCHQDAKSVA